MLGCRCVVVVVTIIVVVDFSLLRFWCLFSFLFFLFFLVLFFTIKMLRCYLLLATIFRVFFSLSFFSSFLSAAFARFASLRVCNIIPHWAQQQQHTFTHLTANKHTHTYTYNSFFSLIICELLCIFVCVCVSVLFVLDFLQFLTLTIFMHFVCPLSWANSDFSHCYSIHEKKIAVPYNFFSSSYLQLDRKKHVFQLFLVSAFTLCLSYSVSICV